MQMKNRKRFLAFVAAAAMVIAPCSAFATTTSSAIDGMGGTGDGKVEGWVEKEYFEVEYPTIADGELDFIMDPQELLKAVGASSNQYTGATFEDGKTLFFKTTGNTTDWTSYSKDYELRIWSTSVVDVTLSATVSSGSIEVCTDSAFTANEKPSIYMAIETAAADTSALNTGAFTVAAVVDPSTKVGTTSVTTKALDVDNDFVITDTGKNGGYKFELASAASAKARSIKFRLTGAANSGTNANWKDVVDVKPTVDLVWSVAPQGAGGTEVYAALNTAKGIANISAGPEQTPPVRFPAGTVITDFKVAGNDCAFTFNSEAGGYISATGPNMRAAAGDKWDRTGTVVTFKADGKPYKTTLIW